MVGEVELQLHQRGDVEQLLAKGFQLAAEPATHLAHGQAMLAGRGGGDQVGHRLGLAQVHLAVHEGPLGELAGLGQAAARGDERPQDALLDVGRPVAGDLDRVLAREGVRRPEKGHHHVVDRLAALGQRAVGERVGRLGGKGLSGPPCLEQAVANGDGLGARYADDRDAAHAGRGRYGANCLVCHERKFIWFCF